MPISRIGTDGIDQTSSQQIGGISVGRGGGAVSTNTAVGASALTTNSTGPDATVVGYQAGYSSTGGYLTAVGYKAGYAVSSGTDNVFMGWNTGLSTTTGSSNVAMGDNAFRTNTTGGSNLALGHAALYSNTTASNNTAVGYQALYPSTGINNTALGSQAGYSNSTGTKNTFLGVYAGYGNTTGFSNTYVGAQGAITNSGCAELMTTGSKNTIIGAYNGNQNSLDIRTANNYMVMSDGDGSIGQYWRNVGPGNAIDSRIGNSNHAISVVGESGTINSGSSATVNVNGYGGDGCGGFILITTAASDGTNGYDTTTIFAHTHGSAYNTYSSSFAYTSVNSITITNPPSGAMVITNNSGKTIKYQSRFLNLGSKAITLA